ACHAALDIDPDLVAARSLLGMVEEERGNLAQALAEYEAVLRLMPTRTAERERAERLRAQIARSAEPALLEEVAGCRVILLDFHAEATAEKRAMGYYLDGRVSAVFGTHTHVQTADEQILPAGTGYITDLGMTGCIDSVLGVTPESSVAWLKSGLPAKFAVAEGPQMLCGCVFEIDSATGRCTGVERICVT
ncbi:MAG TPA: YmdB family metallophosphoesterase, partial [Clostridiales bacterium]|nr:YmdB family metallophosphoesterase [Clostridiales bacterium]